MGALPVEDAGSRAEVDDDNTMTVGNGRGCQVLNVEWLNVEC